MLKFDDVKRALGQQSCNTLVEEEVINYCTSRNDEQMLFVYNEKRDLEKLGDIIMEELLNLFMTKMPKEEAYNEVINNYFNLVTGFINWLSTYPTNGEPYFKYNTPENEEEKKLLDILKNLDKHKGWFIFGNTGVGKTTFMDCVSMGIEKFNRSAYQREGFIFYSHGQRKYFCLPKVTAKQIIDDSLDGKGIKGKNIDGHIYGGYEKYYAITPTNWRRCCENFYIIDKGTNQYGDCYGAYPALFIDDYAWSNTAESVKSFGNTYNPLNDVIYSRYNNNLLTFVTTNKLPTNLDDATKDRLKGLFNFVPIPRQKSFR